MSPRRRSSQQLNLFVRDCPACYGTGWRTVHNVPRYSQSGGNGRSWYELAFRCMSTNEKTITEKTWGWINEVFGEEVPYGQPVAGWISRVCAILNRRYKYHAREPISARMQCDICRGKRKVSFTVYENYFLSTQNSKLNQDINHKLGL